MPGSFVKEEESTYSAFELLLLVFPHAAKYKPNAAARIKDLIGFMSQVFN
jgi:hypothetical protein